MSLAEGLSLSLQQLGRTGGTPFPEVYQQGVLRSVKVIACNGHAQHQRASIQHCPAVVSKKKLQFVFFFCWVRPGKVGEMTPSAVHVHCMPCACMEESTHCYQASRRGYVRCTQAVANPVTTLHQGLLTAMHLMPHAQAMKQVAMHVL